MSEFIKLKDYEGKIHILNKDNIIHIKEKVCSGSDYESVIEYGSGFLDAIYMKETVLELNKKYKFVTYHVRPKWIEKEEK